MVVAGIDSAVGRRSRCGDRITVITRDWLIGAARLRQRVDELDEEAGCGNRLDRTRPAGRCPAQERKKASTSLMAIGLYSMPYWSSGKSPFCLLARKTTFAGVPAAEVPEAGRSMRSGLIQCVIVESGSRKSMSKLIMNWSEPAHSAGVQPTAEAGSIHVISALEFGIRLPVNWTRSSVGLFETGSG